MKLETNFLRSLIYTEVNLKDVDLVPESALDDEELSGIAYKDGKHFTKTAIKNLCSYLKIPYQFTKQLQTIGRVNVIVYLQKQLSQVNDFNVILVEDKEKILCITDEEKLHYKGTEISKSKTQSRILS
jgi:predicted ATP-dependent endonuclease of OLD family